MSKYWSPVVQELTPYAPGEQPRISNVIKLNTNENPYGPSPLVLAVLTDNIEKGLRLYPDPDASTLKAAIAKNFSVRPAQVFVGNGSDEVLAHTFQALLKHPDPILFPDITYSFYPVYCRLYGIDYQTIPLTESFEISTGDYLRKNGGIIFPNPNAPTGIAMPLASIESLLMSNPDSVVVIDEAYVDFGGETAIGLVDQYPNLLVVQTLSKSRSLAGLRVGCAIGNAKLIEALERVKNSFNSYPLDRLAIVGAVAAVEDRGYFEQTCRTIVSSREALSTGLKQLGFEVLPSKANFIFARHPKADASRLAQSLREKAILVRHFPYDRIDQFLRISVGTDEECAALIVALKDILYP